MVATAVLADDQLTKWVAFCELPSLYVPVAWNCSEVPTAAVPDEGVIASDTKVGEPTFRFVVALTDPKLTWIVETPSNRHAASPVLLTVATTDRDELQVAVLVRSCVLPSV